MMVMRGKYIFFPMMQTAIDAFKQLWFELYNEKLDDATAIAIATNLLTAYAAVFRAVKKEWLEDSPIDIHSDLKVDDKP